LECIGADNKKMQGHQVSNQISQGWSSHANWDGNVSKWHYPYWASHWASLHTNMPKMVYMIYCIPPLPAMILLNSSSLWLASKIQDVSAFKCVWWSLNLQCNMISPHKWLRCERQDMQAGWSELMCSPSYFAALEARNESLLIWIDVFP
jgi:hypothetical protein